MRFCVGDIVRWREVAWDRNADVEHLGRIHYLVCDHDMDIFWVKRVILHGGGDILPDSIISNVTQRYQRIFAAKLIWRYWRRYEQERRARIQHALKILQDHCIAWSVSPNNPHHMKRMRAIADAHGMV